MYSQFKEKCLEIIITLYQPTKPLWQEFEKTCCLSEHLLGSVAVAIPSKQCIVHLYVLEKGRGMVVSFSRWLLVLDCGDVVPRTTATWRSTELMVGVPSASSHPLLSTYIAITTLALQPYKFFLLLPTSESTLIITVLSSSEALSKASVVQEEISEGFLHWNDFILKKINMKFSSQTFCCKFSYLWFVSSQDLTYFLTFKVFFF